LREVVVMDITKDSGELKIHRFKALGYWTIGILLLNVILLMGFPEWLGIPTEAEPEIAPPAKLSAWTAEEVIDVSAYEPGVELVEMLPDAAAAKRREKQVIEISGLEVTGIAYFGQGNSYCIINDTVFREGERILPGINLSKIHADRVEIAAGSKILVLPLKKQ